MESYKDTDKIEHLNLALRAIRNVNRLLVKEKDRKRLLKGICDILVKNRGYDKVWIAVTDGSGTWEGCSDADIDKEFITIIENLEKAVPINCARVALKQTEPILIKNPSSTCLDCPLSADHAGWGAITVQLMYENNPYGLLSVSIPKELISDDVEQALIKEIAEDIAYGLHRIKQDEAHRKANAALSKRVKELNYVFAFSNLVEKPDISLEQILQGAVDLLPSAMQYPGITCAQVILEDSKFKTANFKITHWKLAKDIVVDEKIVGILEVYHLEEKPDADNGPFLNEEVQLINSIAMRMGKTIERKYARKALEESEKRFRELVENSLTCISIIQNDKIVFQNPEHIRLFGPSKNAFILTDNNNIHPDDIDAFTYSMEEFMSGRVHNVDMEFRFHPVGKQKQQNKMEWVHCRMNRIEHQGKSAILMNLMDISHTKELEHLLGIQDKMTSLGRVAAGIAHEIRNPLSGINIYLKSLEKIISKNDSTEKVNKILSQLQSASNKIESVIKRVMDFSRPTEPSFILTDINIPVKEAVDLSSVTLRKSGVNIEANLAADLPECHADPQMIEQVILNLITNASEAMKFNEGEKRIQVTSFAENNTICVCVEDSGPGVPKMLRDKIFDPFYTTRHNNSGIGLSISHRIISDHGGILDVLTSYLGGAEFIIKLPVIQQNLIRVVNI